MPLVYLALSLKYGARAGDNPWGATGLEWQTASPPPKDNFTRQPVVTASPYLYHETGQPRASNETTPIRMQGEPQ
jgi:cytochrome c oxidase subunit 1